jgi:hypothetical protein
MGKIIERLGILFKGQNMIKSGHDGPHMSHWGTCWKGYGSVDALRWNLEVEPFVV